MKRIIALTLVLVALAGLCACGKKEAAVETIVSTTVPTEATTESTTEPTTVPTEPASEPGVIRADGFGVTWCTYQRGDKVTVIGKWGSYYIIEDSEKDHLVEERFVRLPSEEVPEAYEGWARYNTQVFASAHLKGEPIATLAQNTKLQIQDSKAGWVFVQWEKGSGYVNPEKVSKWRISSGGGSSDNGSGGGNSGNSGGSGGSSDGSDVDLGSLSARQGAFQITLLGAYSGPVYEKLTACEGTILSDKTEGYWAVLARDSEVKVTEVTAEECTLYLGDSFVQIPRWMVRLAQDEAYTPWDAYSRWGTKAFSGYQITTELETFKTNQKVLVIDELVELGLYVVKLDTGFGYVAKAGLGKWPVSSGGGSSDDGSGGGSSGGGGGGGAEWTPPAL